MLILKRRYEYWFCLLALHKHRRGRHPGHAPADEEGHRLPQQRGGREGHRLRRRGEGPGQRRCRARRSPPRSATAIALGAQTAKGGTTSRPGMGTGVAATRVSACPTREHGPHAPVLHLRHHGHAQDGPARLHLSPRPHPHRQVLAERAGRRAAPHRGRHRLGQGGLGQDLRPVAVRLRASSSTTTTASFPRTCWASSRSTRSPPSARPPRSTASSSRRTCESTTSRALKYCTVAGEPLNPEVYTQFLDMTGLKLTEGYGQTEMTVAVARVPVDGAEARLDGQAVPGLRHRSSERRGQILRGRGKRPDRRAHGRADARSACSRATTGTPS